MVGTGIKDKGDKVVSAMALKGGGGPPGGGMSVSMATGLIVDAVVLLSALVQISTVPVPRVATACNVRGERHVAHIHACVKCRTGTGLGHSARYLGKFPFTNWGNNLC